MKKLLSTIGIFVFVLIITYFSYDQKLQPVDNSDVRTIFKVEKGSSTAVIADQLYGEHLIRSPFAFKFYAKKSGNAAKLKAGSFVLMSKMSTPEIIEMLAGGKSAEEIITIPEGYTLNDIDALMAKKGITTSGALLDCARTCDFSTFTFLPNNKDEAERAGKLEGYLFPDTYYVTLDGFVPKFFLERLLTTFKHRVVEDLAPDIKSSKRSFADIITMASLIEEETRNESERAIVSGILWKRLDTKMGLGVDAAVRYFLDKPVEAITKQDLEVDSPYNLRKIRGLPPSPIASPSLSSIKAALHPKDSPYFYYLHGSDGAIHYATTNDEHNVNKAKYLR